MDMPTFNDLELEEKCLCYIRYGKPTDGKPCPDCEYCKGTGLLLTDFGAGILEFVQKYLNVQPKE